MMSKKDLIQNSFEKGMYTDSIPERQPDGTYTYALNAVNSSHEHLNVFTNESSNDKWVNVPGTIVGASHIDERNATLYFSSDGGLYLVSHDKPDEPQLVMKDSEAGCDWGFGRCEFMYGEFKNMQPCNDLHVYFSSGCEYYVVNIDEMLSEERRECALEEGCNYFKLFRCICGPKITPVAIEGGGFLRAGSYQFIAQLEDNDGNTTNWFDLTQPVYVGSENNIGGEVGNSSIKVQVDQLEKGYTVLNLAVIKRIRGVTTAEVLPPLAYNSKSITYEYYGDNPDAIPVELEEILLKGKKYLRGKDLIQKDNILFLYNIKQEILPNYQRYANSISVKWVEYEASAEAQKRYHFPSLMRGETYALGIVLKYCDGTYSNAFHIPGSPSGSSGSSSSEESEQRTGSVSDGIIDAPEGGDVNTSTLGGVPIENNQALSDSSNMITSYPYNEDFEDQPEWKSNKGWIRTKEFNQLNNTGPSSAFEGDYCSVAKSKYKGEEIYLTGPVFSFENSESITLTFNYYMYGSDVKYLNLQASVDGETYYTIWSRSGDQGNEWKTAVVPLTQYKDSYMSFRFATNPGGDSGDIGIDNINILKTESSEGSGGGSSNSSSASSGGGGASAQYDSASYDGSKSFIRKKGNHTCEKLNNKKLEEEVEEEIEKITSQEKPEGSDAIEHFGEKFGVPEIGDIWQKDIDDVSNTIQSVTELLKGYTEDDECPEVTGTSTIKDAALSLIRKGVFERERDELKKSDWDFIKPGRYLGGSKIKVGEPMSDGDFSWEGVSGSPVSDRGDQWVNAYAEDMIEESIVELRSEATKVYNSNIPYPNICDCEGNRMFPEGNITHHTMPDNNESTHYVSNTVGVIHKKDGANVEWTDTFVRPLGLKLENIYLPSEDELPKPLCPVSPFKIVMAKRDLNDRSVIAKGLVTACFTGSIRGREHAFPKHGVNSFECVDRYIENGDSKIGVNSSPNCYNFHSLDTNAQKIPLTSNQFKNYLELFGSGWRHGQYSKGQKPTNWYTGSRIDQRGTRQSIYLGGQLNKPGEQDLEGITYAYADSIATGPSISLPLMNRFREKSVYFQLNGSLPGLTNGKKGAESDSSFVGDTLDHEAPIKTAAGWYGAMFREIPDQYGTVENMRYVDSGINATIYHAGGGMGSTTSISGLTGDVFIGPYSFRRTGFVSNKVGNVYPIANGSDDGRVTPWKRDRTICDHPWDANFQYLGMEHWPTRLPESGDVADGKNWAGLHTTDIVYSAEGASNRDAPDSDYYYPKVVKTLVTYWGEFEVNPYFRQTGTGPQKVDGKVFYPELKDLYLDSSDSEDHPWEESWLNRIYTKVTQPSLSALNLKAAIKIFMGVVSPLLASAAALELESIPDTALAVVVYPIIAALWTYAQNTLFTDQWIDKMLGIPRCKTDEEGGEDERCDGCPTVVGFEDNYHAYQFDFSKRNDVQSFFGIPRNYNTCKCDNCEEETTNEIFYSEKQILASQIDSYRNFKSNNYRNLPAHAGYLKKLFVEGNRFYAHCTDGIWILQYANTAIPSSIGNIILGKGDLLAEPQLMMEGSLEGHIGIQDPNAAITCSTGYYWVDYDGRALYRMYGGKIERISDYGMRNFFKEKIGFCYPETCRDEKVRGVYYSLGYDHRYDRFLISKRDGEECGSWTMSYNPNTKAWISFHSYLPMMYVWDRSKLFSVKPGTGEVWLHNKDRKSYQTYYGSYQPFILDFVAKHSSGEAWKYYHTMLDTEAQQIFEDDYLYERHVTFTEMAMWNGTQSTGIHKIIPRTDSPDTEDNLLNNIKDSSKNIPVVYEGKQWRINQLYDFIVDINGKVLQRPCECSPYVEPRNVDGINLSIQNAKETTFFQRYLYHRYVFDDKKLNNHKLYVKSNITSIHHQMR